LSSCEHGMMGVRGNQNDVKLYIVFLGSLNVFILAGCNWQSFAYSIDSEL